MIFSIAYPLFIKEPVSLTIEAGNTARLDCAATGDPQPQIAWQKDGGHDFPAARERRMHYMPQDVSFYITQAKISDQGVYTCTAENNVGIITANATLTINGELYIKFIFFSFAIILILFLLAAPSFVKLMENKEAVSGKSIVLECMATGSPKPTLKWSKDNKTIETTERHFFAADNQLLIIVDAKFSDNGNYKCEITNHLGTENGVTNLTVNPIVIAQIFNFRDMMGVVIITIFCCVVVTSCVWVIIIYQAKKRNKTTYNNSTTKCQYACPSIQNDETSFIGHNTRPVAHLSECINSSTRARSYIGGEVNIVTDDNNDELNPLHNDSSIDEPDNDRPSSVIINKHKSCENILSLNITPPSMTQSSPLPSPPPTPVPTPPSPYNTMPSMTTHETDNTINMDDIQNRVTKLNHNLLENKLNKFDSLIMNGNGNVGGGGGIANTNSKISCISICSLDSVHSLKQSL